MLKTQETLTLSSEELSALIRAMKAQRLTNTKAVFVAKEKKEELFAVTIVFKQPTNSETLSHLLFNLGLLIGKHMAISHTQDYFLIHKQ